MGTTFISYVRLTQHRDLEHTYSLLVLQGAEAELLVETGFFCMFQRGALFFQPLVAAPAS